MQEYTCIFYETADGKRPVEKFIESLDAETQDKFVIKQQLLQDFGPQLRHPHTDHLGEGLFELRFQGKEGQIRILFFFFYEKRIIFTNGFIKKARKAPRREIEIAQERKIDFLTRSK